jgi:hypothetical protein
MKPPCGQLSARRVASSDAPIELTACGSAAARPAKKGIAVVEFVPARAYGCGVVPHIAGDWACQPRYIDSTSEHRCYADYSIVSMIA